MNAVSGESCRHCSCCCSPYRRLSVALLLPIDLKGYAKSVFATLTFIANIYFWRDANYFSRLAEEKPLLHVWSLGIEEQFYIGFPLLVLLCASDGVDLL